MGVELATVNPEAGGMLQAIDRAALADSTKTKYRAALAGYLETGCSPFDAEALSAYAEALSASGRAFLKAAVRLYSDDLTRQAKAGATPENVQAVQAVVYRVEALRDAIRVSPSKGEKAHLWLTLKQVKALMATCDTSLQGRRDRLALALLSGAGLRREEAAGLEWASVKTQAVKGKLRTVLEVCGKGAKDRVIPVSDALARLLDDWSAVVKSGRVLRSVSKSGQIGGGLSAVAIFQIVQAHGARIGLLELAPHDLRRTYAQIGYDAGVSITQISKLLGHANVATTQRYLNLDLDLETTVSDFVPVAG